MRRLLLIAITLFIAGSALSQPIRLGVKAGVSTLNTDIRNIHDVRRELKSRDVGFTAGIMMRLSVPFTGIYAQPELMYNYARYDFIYEDGSRSKLSYHNIELPVLFGYKILIFRANVGPVFNLKTFNKGSNYFDVYRPDVGYIAGVGATLWKFDIDLRYHGYFQKTVKHRDLNDVHLNDDMKVNNGMITLTVGTYF